MSSVYFYLDKCTTNLERARNNINTVASEPSREGLNIEVTRKNPISFNLTLLAYFSTQSIES